MFSKILIANRGEIANRIQLTCRRLGVDTVAVYSDADVDSVVVNNATVAVRLGTATAADSYLDHKKVIAAALATGAEAIHPGYGFLSENAEFAAACAAAGLAFIGPKPDTIALMGSKIASKNTMHDANVPIVPGYNGAQQDPQLLAKEASRIGFPLLIKASAGGGGKGMRIVHEASGFNAALEAAKREARSAFGDDKVLLEKFIEQPRHIEVQVFGDAHGNTVHLFERECSIQRRYQKVIEESPSPFVTPQLRAEITAAAVTAARAVGYENAGTVEFLVDNQRNFYFMEMNTRLQVEHAVTEMVTGVDLVEWQLIVAAGGKLPVAQEQISSQGHAIEARLYSEDPHNNFLPATGLVHRFVYPTDDAAIRVDTALREGDRISMFYDPMIAKLITHGADRDQALAKMRTALATTALLQPANNLGLLRNIAQHETFVAGSMDTSYLDQHLSALLINNQSSDIHVCAAVLLAVRSRASVNDTPWDQFDSWQANGASRNRVALMMRSGERIVASASGWANSIDVHIGDRSFHLSHIREDGHALYFHINDKTEQVWFCKDRHLVQISHDQVAHEFAYTDLYPLILDQEDALTHPGSPMPGRIVEVLVKTGDSVEVGQKLLTLEGMKMEFTLTAGVKGTIAKIHHAAGDLVEAEVSLVDITPAE